MLTIKRADITDEMVCRAYAERDRGRDDFADVILAEMSGAPLKVCWSAMERAEDHGLLECGVSLRSGWLTNKGRELVGLEPLPFN